MRRAAHERTRGYQTLGLKNRGLVSFCLELGDKIRQRSPQIYPRLCLEWCPHILIALQVKKSVLFGCKTAWHVSKNLHFIMGTCVSDGMENESAEEERSTLNRRRDTFCSKDAQITSQKQVFRDVIHSQPVGQTV